MLAPKSTLFRNVRVFDGTSTTLSSPTNVLVVGNLITTIDADAATPNTDTLLINGNGKTLMPGLIDTHVHITMSSWSQEEALADTVRAVRRSIEAGVKCVEHGQLLDEATLKLMADQGIWLSLQVLDPPPPNANPFNAAKKMQVIEGTDNAYRWAKKHGVKLAWGTDFLFDPKQNGGQNSNMLKLKQWFNAQEILKMVTHDNAQLLALSGPRSPYVGKLGVVETGALADLLLVQGDPLANVDILGDPSKNFALIMKDGKIYKNAITN